MVFLCFLSVFSLYVAWFLSVCLFSVIFVCVFFLCLLSLCFLSAYFCCLRVFSVFSSMFFVYVFSLCCFLAVRSLVVQCGREVLWGSNVEK